MQISRRWTDYPEWAGWLKAGVQAPGSISRGRHLSSFTRVPRRVDHP